MNRTRTISLHKEQVTLLNGFKPVKSPPPTLDEAEVTLSTAVNFARSTAWQLTQSLKDDPFYVCDIGRFLQKHEQWKTHLPRVHPHYAVKCNDDPLMVHILAQLGCGFDCASKGEIDRILAMGVEPSRIIFANPCKPPSHVRHALACGVRLLTFDNEEELQKIHRIYPNAELVLRIAVLSNYSKCKMNRRSGCDPANDAVKLLKLAAKLGAHVVGVAFHVGTASTEPSLYATSIAHARRLFDEGKALGHDMHILDIGGGYPGFPSDDPLFSEIATVVNKALENNFSDISTMNGNSGTHQSPLRIFGEPGRYFATSAFLLCVNVIGKVAVPANVVTEKDSDADQQGYMYQLNDGVYGSFNFTLFDHVPEPHPKLLFDQQKHTAKEYWSKAWGPTCGCMDCIFNAIRLPELNVGDWLLFENMGAYTTVSASEFNGFEKPVIHYVCSEVDWAQLLQFLSADDII